MATPTILPFSPRPETPYERGVRLVRQQRAAVDRGFAKLMSDAGQHELAEALAAGAKAVVRGEAE